MVALAAVAGAVHGDEDLADELASVAEGQVVVRGERHARGGRQGGVDGFAASPPGW